ncbi:hypothetical protein PROFUN_16593 [Planoprotostelium fungivorum]|uniref:Uncharacterized protein n=1 Tax=Planoprotostelium fungivorum TaxID=1890364 RepID=A0A2P6MP04_9EUKA|nr:hypothetical protein PROFUN_16593 [Planoprotostelium fungivorum]
MESSTPVWAHRGVWCGLSHGDTCGLSHRGHNNGLWSQKTQLGTGPPTLPRKTARDRAFVRVYLRYTQRWHLKTTVDPHGDVRSFLFNISERTRTSHRFRVVAFTATTSLFYRPQNPRKKHENKPEQLTEWSPGLFMLMVPTRLAFITSCPPQL